MHCRNRLASGLELVVNPHVIELPAAYLDVVHDTFENIFEFNALLLRVVLTGEELIRVQCVGVPISAVLGSTCR